MKNLILFIFIISTCFFACQNNSKLAEKKETKNEFSKKIETPTEKTIQKNVEEKTTSNSPEKEVTLPSTEEGVDYWAANNCKLKAPKPTVPKEKRPGYYSFNVNKEQGFAKEVLELENGYKLDITSKGCNSIVITHSYFMYAKELDIKDSKAVSEKIIELLDMVSKISDPAINIKSRIPALKGAVDQIGPFSVGEEFILVDGEIKENFILQKLEEKNGKIFLSYYFSKGPL